MSKLSIELTCQPDAWILELNGHVNSSTAHLIWSADSSVSLLKEMRQAQVKRLVLNLANVELIDSHGLRVLLNAHKDFSAENIQITLKNPNPHLKRLLRIMQFDRVFEVESSD